MDRCGEEASKLVGALSPVNQEKRWDVTAKERDVTKTWV